MTTASYVQQGASIDYTPSGAVSAGDVVVLRDLIGIAKLDIAASALGALAIEGVFDVAKDDDATTGTIFALGQGVYWDATNEQATPEPAGMKYMGIAVAAAAKTAATVRVSLQQDVGGDEELPAAFQGLTFEDVAVDKTLDIEDVGKVINVTVDAKTITLPAVAAGLRFVIRCGAADGTVGLAVSPNASDKIMGADLAGVDNKDRLLVKATAVLGDYIVLTYGGATGWLVEAEVGTWSAEA